MAQVDPEVEQATQAALTHREAYAARVSRSTRNPHTARKGRPLEDLLKLSHEERVLVQWRTAFGCPLSDEAKAQFVIECLGHSFHLADVRLWLEKHPQRDGKEVNTRHVYLEFFFDGQLSEIQEDPPAFQRAFERMIECQLQAKRMTEFRNKLTTRRRNAAGGATATSAGEDAEGGGSMATPAADDGDWKNYLAKPVQPTDLSIRSMREAGCMIRFLVCQTSLSPAASEELGQIAFQEHFPIDGKEQVIPASTKPMPKWVYWVGLLTVLLGILTLMVMWKAFSSVLAPAAPLPPP